MSRFQGAKTILKTFVPVNKSIIKVLGFCLMLKKHETILFVEVLNNDYLLFQIT